MTWHSSDVEENHAGIIQWLDEAGLSNTPAPLTLYVTQKAWPEIIVDAIFSANAVYIMAWDAVMVMISGVGQLLSTNGQLVLYGPFNYKNNYTSDSNARFDICLKEQNPDSAIRNFEDIEQLANAARLYLQNDFAMPANNRILSWIKQ